MGEDYHGGFVNPSFVIVEQVDRKGRFDPTSNVVVDGRRVEGRARVERVAKKGYCFSCRESVRRTEVSDVTFANGREATVGGCVNCGAGVYRTGSAGDRGRPGRRPPGRGHGGSCGGLLGGMWISSSEVFNWVSRAFENPAPELNWETKHTRKSSTWTAITPEGDRYAGLLEGHVPDWPA